MPGATFPTVMESTKSVSVPYVVADDEISRPEAEAAIAGAIVAEDDVGILDVTGHGVIPCLQGLLTNDIEGAGDGSFLYAALLTQKGMIVCDMWVARHGSHAWLTVPARGADSLFSTFKRFLPPRLARASDHSDQFAVLRIAGPETLDIAGRAGIGVPEPGVSSNTVVGGAACVVSRPTHPAPFGLQIQLDREGVSTILDSLRQAGAVVAVASALELTRILAGWPRLGAEIDDKTLPQEVRFDENNGVSYTKGCYTGQETVARVHFRGRVNKHLTGLIWEGKPDPTNPSIYQDDKPIGRVSSVAWLPPFEQHIGLGIVKRQADTDRLVTAAGATAVITSIPFELEP
jgi:folate-binding protein YgfZ